MSEARLLGTGLIVVSALGFGTLGLSSRAAAEHGLDTFGYVAWRSTLGGLAILAGVAVAAAMGYPALARRGGVPRREWLALGAAALMGAGLNLSIFAAFGRTTIAVALITFYSFPALVTLAAVRVYGEPLDARRVTALAIASMGLILVVLAPALEGGDLQLDAAGVGLAFTAALFQTGYALVIGRGFKSIPSGLASGLIVVVGGLVGVALALIAGQANRLWLPFEAEVLWPWVFLAAIIGAAIPTAANVTGIRLLGPSRAAILMMIEPVVGVTLAAVLLAERPVPLQFVGGAAVLIAGVILQVERRSSVAA